MKISCGSDNSPENYEQSKCANCNNQELTDNLDYIIGLLTQSTNKLLYSRIRIQNEPETIEVCYPHALSIAAEQLQNMAEGIRHCCREFAERAKRATPGNEREVDPSVYDRS